MHFTRAVRARITMRRVDVPQFHLKFYLNFSNQISRSTGLLAVTYVLLYVRQVAQQDQDATVISMHCSGAQQVRSALACTGSYMSLAAKGPTNIGTTHSHPD
jgi:hypothetical protein